MITFVDDGFEDLYFLFGDDGPVQTPDEFFCFSRKHTTGYHFDPARLLPRGSSAEVWFNKHGAKYPAGRQVCKFRVKFNASRFVRIAHVGQLIFFWHSERDISCYFSLAGQPLVRSKRSLRSI